MLMHCHHHRLIYNTGLTQRQYWTQAKRHYKQAITTATQMRELAAARQDPDLDWLKNGPSVVHQGALRDLDRAFTNFFAGRAGYPRPKRKHAARHVFTVRDIRIIRYNHKWACVHLPKIGYVRFRLTRPFRTITVATSARVTLHGGHWHISFTTTPPAPVSELREPTGAAVGIDRGVANSVATSDGEFVHAPGFTPGEQERFLALQRRLSRQRNKASKRRARTRHSLAVMHRRLRDRRRDWIEQTSTLLAGTYDRVVLEDLNTTGMTKRPAPKTDPAQAGAFLPNQARAKAALNRAILASCWGGLATRLRDKTIVITINPRHTSQECRMCGHTRPATVIAKRSSAAASVDTLSMRIRMRRVSSSSADWRRILARGHRVTGRIKPAPLAALTPYVAKRQPLPSPWGISRLQAGEDVKAAYRGCEDRGLC